MTVSIYEFHAALYWFRARALIPDCAEFSKRG